MISQFKSLLVRARWGAVSSAAVLGLVGLASLPSAHAAGFVADPAAVVPNDTYNVDVVGFNTSFPSQNIYLTDPTKIPTFGTMSSFTNGALGGQTFTVTSSETTAGGVTTDTIRLSVPLNFVPAGTLDNGGHTLNAIQFSFGNYLGGTDTLDLSTGISTYNVTTLANFSVNGVPTTLPGGATSMLTNSGKALSAFGQTTATAPTTDIANNVITAFTFTVTYAVPEPSTVASVLLGAGALLWITVKRRRTGVSSI